MTDDIILGLAEGYGYHTLKPFLFTLRKSGFKGRIVLFSNSLSNSSIRRINIKFGAEVIKWNANHPYLSDLTNRTCDIHVADIPMSPNVVRYLIYLDYLTLNSDSEANGKVFLADTRDIIFQDDISKMAIEDELICFLEYDDHLIKDNGVNEAWVKQAYGEPILNEMAEMTVSCSGFTVGSYTQMIAYLRIMCEEIARLSVQKKALLGGIDQGIHNYLLYHNHFKGVCLAKNAAQGVITLSGNNAHYMDNNGNVTDEFGNRMTVVHQYDRIGELLKRYNLLKYLRHIDCKVIKNKLSRLIGK